MTFLVPDTTETERLTLRQFAISDMAAVGRMLLNEDVQRYLGGPQAKPSDHWKYISSSVGHWALRGYGPYAVVEKASGDFVGRVGFLHPETWPGLEIAWTLDRPHWGKGYATEAAIAIGRIGFGILKADRLISLIHPENIDSQKVAGRMGATLEGYTDYFGAELAVHVYRHDPARFD